MAGGFQVGVLYINLIGPGIVRYDLGTHTYAPIGLASDATAFEYGGDGYWYMNSGSLAPNHLYKVRLDLPGAAPVLVGAGSRNIEDIAVSPDGLMYGVGEGYLFRIDRATGAQTDIGQLGFQAEALAFSAEAELLTADGARLMRLDPVTGQATFEADLPWAVQDLAADPGGQPPVTSVPSASAGALLAAGLVLLLATAVRLRRGGATL